MGFDSQIGRQILDRVEAKPTIVENCRGRGIRSNEKPRTPATRELKDHTGFLVSRSLTLTGKQGGDFPCTKKKP